MGTFNGWKTENIDQIRPEEFYNLIDRNREHIRKTFPVTLSNCTDLQKTTEHIAASHERENNKEGYYYYIRNADSNALIGYVVIKNINTALAKCEFAYFIDKDFEGRGIISKAVADTLGFCFGDLQMNKVYICTSKVNYASQRIALKQGFIQEGILREEFRNGEGELEDIMYFGLLKSDYNER